MPALFFGFSVLVQLLSRAWSCPQLVGLERTEATLLALGRCGPEGLGHLSPGLCLHRAQLGWHSGPAIVFLVTHSHQTLLEILDKVGSRDIFSFIPAVKYLLFVSCLLRALALGGNCLSLAPSPPWLPWTHRPGVPGADGVPFISVSQPQRCLSDSVARHRPHWDPGGRTKQTGSQMEVDKKGQSGGAGGSQSGCHGMGRTEDEGDPGRTRALPLHPSSLCDISRWESVVGASPGCPDWPSAGSLLEWPFLLLTPVTSAARELLTGPSRHQVCMALSWSQCWAALPQLLHWPEHSSSAGHGTLWVNSPLPSPFPFKILLFSTPFCPRESEGVSMRMKLSGLCPGRAWVRHPSRAGDFDT